MAKWIQGGGCGAPCSTGTVNTGYSAKLGYIKTHACTDPNGIIAAVLFGCG